MLRSWKWWLGVTLLVLSCAAYLGIGLRLGADGRAFGRAVAGRDKWKAKFNSLLGERVDGLAEELRAAPNASLSPAPPGWESGFPVAGHMTAVRRYRPRGAPNRAMVFRDTAGGSAYVSSYTLYLHDSGNEGGIVLEDFDERLDWGAGPQYGQAAAFREAGAAASVAAGLVWVCALLSLPFLWRRRRLLGQIMLAAALVLAVARCGEPLADDTATGWHWLLTPGLVFGVMGGIGLVCCLLPGRRERTTRCAKCDYDLRGNTSGVCPECGDPIPGFTRSRRRQAMDDRLRDRHAEALARLAGASAGPSAGPSAGASLADEAAPDPGRGGAGGQGDGGPAPEVVRRSPRRRRTAAWWAGVLVPAAVALAVSLCLPAVRVPLMGYVHGERFFAGKPVSYWAEQNWQWDGDPATDQFRRGGPRAVAVLVELLQRRQVPVRALVLTLPNGPESAAAVPALCAEIGRQPDAELRALILAKLEQIGPAAAAAYPEVVARLIDLLDAPERSVRQAASAALRRVEPSAAWRVAWFRPGPFNEYDDEWARLVPSATPGTVFALKGDRAGLSFGPESDLGRASFTDPRSAGSYYLDTSPLLCAFTVSPDGGRLAAADWQGLLVADVASKKERRLDVEAPALRINDGFHKYAVISLAFSPAGDRLWACGAAGGPVCVNVSDGSVVHDVVDRMKADGLNPAQRFQDMQLSRDGGTLALVEEHSTVSVWDLPSGRLRRRFADRRLAGRPSCPGSLLALSDDGRWVAAGTVPPSGGEGPREGRIELLDTHSGAGVRLEGPGFEVTDLAISPDGRRVAACGDGRVAVWDAPGGKRVAAWGPGAHPAEYRNAVKQDRLNRMEFRAVAFTTAADGRLLLAARAVGFDLRVWEVPPAPAAGAACEPLPPPPGSRQSPD